MKLTSLLETSQFQPTVEQSEDGDFVVSILNDKAGDDLRIVFPKSEQNVYLQQYHADDPDDDNFELVQLTPNMVGQMIRILGATLTEKASG